MLQGVKPYENSSCSDATQTKKCDTWHYWKRDTYEYVGTDGPTLDGDQDYDELRRILVADLQLRGVNNESQKNRRTEGAAIGVHSSINWTGLKRRWTRILEDGKTSRNNKAGLQYKLVFSSLVYTYKTFW